jgi:hypothetical protein
LHILSEGDAADPGLCASDVGEDDPVVKRAERCPPRTTATEPPACGGGRAGVGSWLGEHPYPGAVGSREADLSVGVWVRMLGRFGVEAGGSGDADGEKAARWTS